MYSTQSAPSATTSSMSFVATTPVGSSPHSSPASRPALSGEWTHTPGQLEGRVLDHAAQRPGADVARRPLDDPIALHVSFPPSLCGTQLGGRFSMNARMPSRGSGEWSSAQNMVW